MLRPILLGAWFCTIVLVSLFTIFELTSEGGNPHALEEKGELLKLDSINVPIIVDAKVTGYVIAQFDFLIDPDKAKLLPIPIETLVSGQTYAFLYDRRGRDALQRKSSQLSKTMDELRTAINARYSIDAVRTIEVRQLDFLTKDEIRGMQMRKAENQQ